MLVAGALCLASLTIPVIQKGFEFALVNQLRFLPEGDYQEHIVSLWHLNEVLQSQIIAFATALFFVIWLFWVGRKQLLALPPMFWFLLFLTIAPLGNSITFNAVLGSFDWDLRAFSAIGFATLIPYMLFHLQFPRYIVQALPTFLLLMLGFNYLNTGAWMLMNSRHESVNRIIELMYGEKADYYVKHPPPLILGEVLQANGLNELAEQQLELGCKLYPRETRMYYNYAFFLNKIGKVDEAYTNLYAVYKAAPHYQRVYKLLTKILADREDYKTLEGVLRSFFHEYKNDPIAFQRFITEDNFNEFEYYYMIALCNNNKYEEALEVAIRLMEKSVPYTVTANTSTGEITIQQFAELIKKMIGK